MKEATINIKVVEEAEGIGIYSDIEGEVLLVLEGLLDGIQKLEKMAPSGSKSKFRTLVLQLLNDED